MKNINQKIQELNILIKSKPWLDFELIELVNKKLKIIGSTDFSYFHEIEITFVDVVFLQCPDTWKTNTSEEVISIPSLEEQRKINIGYEIEQGNTVIKLVGEDILGIYIVCRDILYKHERVTYKV